MHIKFSATLGGLLFSTACQQQQPAISNCPSTVSQIPESMETGELIAAVEGTWDLGWSSDFDLLDSDSDVEFSLVEIRDSRRAITEPGPGCGARDDLEIEAIMRVESSWSATADVPFVIMRAWGDPSALVLWSGVAELEPIPELRSSIESDIGVSLEAFSATFTASASVDGWYTDESTETLVSRSLAACGVAGGCAERVMP